MTGVYLQLFTYTLLCRVTTDAPPRPPKPGQPAEELYQNIGSNSPLSLRSKEGDVHLSPNVLRVNPPTNLNNDKFTFPNSTNSSSHNSPAAGRKTELDGRVSPSPASRISVDSLYHNTATLLSSNGANTNGLTKAQNRQDIDSLYDIPKTLNVSAAIPAPPQCSGGLGQTVHKYVNASAGIVSKSADGVDEIELNRQVVDDNHYGLSPCSQVEERPHRPPKPRILSDTIIRDGGYLHSIVLSVEY